MTPTSAVDPEVQLLGRTRKRRPLPGVSMPIYRDCAHLACSLRQAPHAGHSSTYERRRCAPALAHPSRGAHRRAPGMHAMNALRFSNRASRYAGPIYRLASTNGGRNGRRISGEVPFSQLTRSPFHLCNDATTKERAEANYAVRPQSRHTHYTVPRVSRSNSSGQGLR